MFPRTVADVTSASAAGLLQGLTGEQRQHLEQQTRMHALKRSQAAQASVDSVVCAVPRDVFLRMIGECPLFALQVTKLMGLRLRRFSSRIEELLGKSASARLAHTLLDLARQHGIKDGDGVLIPLRLSQASSWA
jgi:CRP-like cAMP-binding protein